MESKDKKRGGDDFGWVEQHLACESVPKRARAMLREWADWARSGGKSLRAALSAASLMEWYLYKESQRVNATYAQRHCKAVLRAVSGWCGLQKVATDEQVKELQRMYSTILDHNPLKKHARKASSETMIRRQNPVNKLVPKVTCQVAADMLGVTPQRLKEWHEAGEYPDEVVQKAHSLSSVKITRKILFDDRLPSHAYVSYSQNPSGSLPPVYGNTTGMR